MRTNGSNSEEIRASTKYIRMFVHKTWRVINQICGCSYEQALMLLEFMPYQASANASRNSNLNKTNLIVSEARVDGGTTLKRFQPRAQGHAYPIHKPTCHITITVKNG
ncbi:hypothetical protein CY35_11G033900 [Sphagnum magellanicum]|nr:hypothetical protein CY35_11G033900 [Sphagnum magellanicum]